MKFKWNNQEYELILFTLAGSRLYGTFNENSDWDYRGVFIAPIETKIGMVGKIEQIDGHGIDKVLSDVLGTKIESDDIVLYEISKFVALAADNNPNILDILFASEDNGLIYANEKGMKLIDSKSKFICKKAKFKFSGYAFSQLKRLMNHQKWINKYPHTGKVLEILKKCFDAKIIDFNWIKDFFGGQVADAICGADHKNYDVTVPNAYFLFLGEGMSDSASDINSYVRPNLQNFITIRYNNFKRVTDTQELNNLLGRLTSGAEYEHISHNAYGIYHLDKPNGGIFSRDGHLKQNISQTRSREDAFDCIISVDEHAYKEAHDEFEALWNWKINRNKVRSELEDKIGYDCYDDATTEFLTEHGWLKYDSISEDTKLATVDVSTGEIQLQNYTSRTDKLYTGHMYLLEALSFKTYITPNHNMLVSECHRKKSNNYSVEYDKETSNWKLQPLSTLISGRKSHFHIRKAAEASNSEYAIEDDYLTLAGFYLSEGTMNFNKKIGTENNTIKHMRIYQTHSGPFFGEMDRLSEIFKLKRYDYKKETIWISGSKSLNNRIYSDFGHSKDKHLPSWCFRLSNRQIRILWSALMLGDGYDNHIRQIYYTSSKKLADDIHAMLVFGGIISSLYGPYLSESSFGTCDMYQLIAPKLRKKVEAVSFHNLLKHDQIPERDCYTVKDNVVKDNRIVCFEVPNSTLITRNSGHISIHGNSKHASHLIRLMIGGLEILTTGNFSPHLQQNDLELVLRVKNGEVSYTELICMANTYEHILNSLYHKVSLRNEPDLNAINELLIELSK